MNLSDFFLFLFSSNEFKIRNLSNEDFLELVYASLLNREPDDGGFFNWLEILNDGGERDFILEQIINSEEYRMKLNNYNL